VSDSSTAFTSTTLVVNHPPVKITVWTVQWTVLTWLQQLTQNIPPAAADNVIMSVKTLLPW